MSLSPSAILEALLFAEGGPLRVSQVCTLLGISAEQFPTVLAELEGALEGRGLSVVHTSTEVELRTSKDASDAVRLLRESELARDLGKASLEALAVVLYRGTATRSEIDWIRGVNSGAALRSLQLRGLIERIEDQTDKRRARYRATVDALAHLGVSKMEDLPRYSELVPMIAEADERAQSLATDTL